MGTKINPGEFDCYSRAYLDEPLFVLLARDPSAPDIVRTWAAARKRMIEDRDAPESDRDMVVEARACAEKMKDWRAANWPRRKRQPPPISEKEQINLLLNELTATRNAITMITALMKGPILTAEEIAEQWAQLSDRDKSQWAVVAELYIQKMRDSNG